MSRVCGKKLIYLLKNNGLNILLVTFLSRKIKTKQNLTTLLSKIFTDNYETTFLMNVSNNKRRNKNRSIPYRPNTKRIKQLYHLYMSTNKSKKQLHHLLYVSELGTCDNCCNNFRPFSGQQTVVACHTTAKYCVKTPF